MIRALRFLWEILTDDWGVILILVAALFLGGWQIYTLGKMSKIDEAHAIVSKERDAHRKEVEGLKKRIDSLQEEKKSWLQEMDDLARRADAKQKEVASKLQARIDELEARGPKVVTVIKEVPKYVTVESDAQCVVPAGFVWLHDESIKDDPFSGSPPGDVEAPSGIALSEVARTVSENNAECAARGEVIRLWQEWYKENSLVFDELQAASLAR